MVAPASPVRMRLPWRAPIVETGRFDTDRAALTLRKAASEPVPARTLDLRGFRPWGAAFAVVLVLIAEGAARLLLPAMPPEGIHEATYRVQEKMVELERTLEEGPVDVAFFGTSIVECGIDPAGFDRLCAERGKDVTSFNLGFCGPGLAGIHAVLDRFFLSKIRPRLVYVCVSPNAINRNRCQAVKDITRRFEATAAMSPVREFLGRSLQQVHLIAYRGDLRRWLTSGCRDELAVRKYGRRGGFMPTEGEPDRDTDYAHRFGGFAPDDRDVAGLEALIAWCDRIGARCVVVDMPITERTNEVLTPEQRLVYEGFLRGLVEEGIEVLRIKQETFPLAEFYDGMHLNPEGAAHLTRLLALHASGRFPPNVLGFGADKPLNRK